MELINKKLVLKIIDEMTVDEGDYKRCTNLIEQLNVIESRPKGKWIFNEDEEVFRCNKCGRLGLSYDDFFIYDFTHDNFCRDCGADMRGETE